MAIHTSAYTQPQIDEAVGKALANVQASMSVVAINADTSSVCSITGAGNSGKTETIIYTKLGKQ
jgi:hypothetical protein